MVVRAVLVALYDAVCRTKVAVTPTTGHNPDECRQDPLGVIKMHLVSLILRYSETFYHVLYSASLHLVLQVSMVTEETEKLD